MAIPAIDANASHMVYMAEWHGLLPRDFLPRSVMGKVQLISRPANKAYKEDSPKNCDACNCVRAVMKNLGHSVIGVPIHSSPLQVPIGKDVLCLVGKCSL